jgi:hypothetical protein
VEIPGEKHCIVVGLCSKQSKAAIPGRRRAHLITRSHGVTGRATIGSPAMTSMNASSALACTRSSVVVIL